MVACGEAALRAVDKAVRQRSAVSQATRSRAQAKRSRATGVERAAQLVHSFASVAVGVDARRGALAGVENGRVVAPAELRARSPAATALSARVRGTSRPGAATATRAGARRREQLLACEMPKCAAGGRLDLGDRAVRAGVARSAGRGRRALRRRARRSSARPVSELKATTRISAPSSARTFVRRRARRSTRARARRRRSTPSCCARLRRIASRVARSGARCRRRARR